ncbi:MAG TPA: hypothetical protein VH500_01000 [Nitrososphaeraceae archaeon]|jgi:hypothetical protein
MYRNVHLKQSQFDELVASSHQYDKGGNLDAKISVCGFVKFLLQAYGIIGYDSGSQ